MLGLRDEIDDDATQLARAPERVEQVQVVVGQQWRGDPACDAAQQVGVRGQGHGPLPKLCVTSVLTIMVPIWPDVKPQAAQESAMGGMSAGARTASRAVPS